MKVLIIQTAFLGDVILATPLVEVLADRGAEVHFVCRSGNESLLIDHPKIKKLWVWDKSRKYNSLWGLIGHLRRQHYDTVYCIQRFFTAGMMAVLAGAKQTIGFDKNPWAPFMTQSFPHIIEYGAVDLHEVDRNLSLLGDPLQTRIRPKLYPSEADFGSIPKTKNHITISPASVWYTKQYPVQRWIDFLDGLEEDQQVYVLGGPGDVKLAEEIVTATKHQRVEVMAGKLSLLQSAALMSSAAMNYTNDSAPTHMASAMNAPVTTMYCSTVPAFGFWPLSDQSLVLEVDESLSCRPCGLHGRAECPLGTMDCAQYAME